MPSSPENNPVGTAVSDMVMPKLGLTMTEGVLSEWHVKPGDHVEPGQVMFVVETDKIANEIEALEAGEIVEILVGSGETVPVGTPLARWTGTGTIGDGAREAGDTPCGTRPARGAATARENAPSPAPGSRVIATPLARRMARQGGVDLAGIAGSGPRGRIKAADVEAALGAAGAGAPDAPSSPGGGDRVPVSSRHLAMVRRVLASAREIPHFQLVRRAEVTPLMAFREALNAAGGPRITLNHLLLKAVGRALIACPEANRIWADDALLAFPDSDVGVVVNTPGGLFVPILRNAGELPLDRLALVSGRLIEQAKAGRLQTDDLEGGAVSISNVGMAGGVESMAPIITPPQSSILGVGAVAETFRPDVEGRPVLARELVLTLACDHRVFDGMSGGRFLEAIAQGLEAPHALLRTTEG